LKGSVKEADERLLVEEAQRDPRRFGALYELNFERVYAYIARRVSNRAEAEDLTSEVFHHALESLGRFEWRGIPFAAWLYRIAGNAIADRWRRTGRERANAVVAEREPVRGVDEEIERQALLFRLVRTLPRQQRRVIELRFGEERNIQEVAQQLGCTPGAVKQLQFRGIQNLRAQMGKRRGAKLGDRNG
jgi:RNA polymerase sigma-70 factor, ECF subfamily